MATDQTVVLNPGAGGANVKTLEIVGLINGQVVTFEIQALSVTDKSGEPVSMTALENVLDTLLEMRDTLKDILEELQT